MKVVHPNFQIFFTSKHKFVPGVRIDFTSIAESKFIECNCRIRAVFKDEVNLAFGRSLEIDLRALICPIGHPNYPNRYLAHPWLALVNIEKNTFKLERSGRNSPEMPSQNGINDRPFWIFIEYAIPKHQNFVNIWVVVILILVDFWSVLEYGLTLN